MKFLPFLLAFIFISCIESRSQTYPSFDATAGVNPAKKIADTIMTEANLVGVLTLGQDKTAKINLPVKVEYIDSNKCCISYGWVYSFRGKSKKTQLDTLLSIEVICVRYNPLYPIIFPTYTFDLKINDTTVKFPNGYILSNNFLGSEKMIENIKATAEYKTFILAYPNSQTSIITLYTNPSCLYFPTNSPIWQLSVGGVNTKSRLSCEVHAITGETKCSAIAVGVEEDMETNNLTIIPSPSINNITITIPPSLFSPRTTIEVYNSIGVKISSYSLTIGLGEKINLPLNGLSEGMYFIKYAGGGKSTIKPIIIQH
jgi:hypothetical protein